TSGALADDLLLESPHIKLSMDWSPNGLFLLYADSDPKTGFDLWAVPMTGDHKPVPVANTPFEERGGQFSGQAWGSMDTGRQVTRLSKDRCGKTARPAHGVSAISDGGARYFHFRGLPPMDPMCSGPAARSPRHRRRGLQCRGSQL
ncbi:MAG TPA: hypothetical protein VEN78_26230, partial [Bradyrhizobium sp.]|nr:hypothetical protein [Bradyrhizobium sp.]